MKYSIEAGVFERVPGYKRAVIVAHDVDNRGQAVELENALRQRIAAIEGDPSIDVNDPRIEAWSRAYTLFPLAKGERPRPSIAALVGRIRKGDGAKIPFISPLVCISNLAALTFMLPSGLIDLNRITGNVTLGPALGTEAFTPFGRDQPQSPVEGELVLCDRGSGAVLCRSWNSRGGRETGIAPETTDVFIDLDALTDVVPDATLHQAAAWTAAMVTTHCGGLAAIHYLEPRSRELEIA